MILLYIYNYYLKMLHDTTVYYYHTTYIYLPCDTSKRVEPGAKVDLSPSDHGGHQLPMAGPKL